MTKDLKPHSGLILLGTLTLLSRLPFLWAGFGSEEDSWLLPLTAKNISESGLYEMSRAPGHPLLELLYASLYNNGLYALYTNLISAISSVIAVVFFSTGLKSYGFRNYIFAGYAFAFTPVVFISSTYTIDYMPAMALAMISWYFVIHARSEQSENTSFSLLLAGVALGIAVGIRITSGALLIPFAILLYDQPDKMKKITTISLATLLTSFIAYLPVISIYGINFFHYSDQFPYPNLFKVIYKATFGAFGLIGLLALGFVKLSALSTKTLIPVHMPRNLLTACILTIILFIISYLRLPQKSAYLIPVIPFTIILASYYVNEQKFKIICILLTASSFLGSINLTDPLRGANRSQASFTFQLGGQEIFVDVLSGPIYADYSKRLKKIEYVDKVFEKTQAEKSKILLISGWWYNQLLVRRWGTEVNENVKPAFYVSQQEMEDHLKMGYKIYYLPEQDLYNDQYSKMKYTNTIAKAY